MVVLRRLQKEDITKRLCSKESGSKVLSWKCYNLVWISQEQAAVCGRQVNCNLTLVSWGPTTKAHVTRRKTPNLVEQN